MKLTWNKNKTIAVAFAIICAIVSANMVNGLFTDIWEQCSFVLLSSTIIAIATFYLLKQFNKIDNK